MLAALCIEWNTQSKLRNSQSEWPLSSTHLRSKYKKKCSAVWNKPSRLGKRNSRLSILTGFGRQFIKTHWNLLKFIQKIVQYVIQFKKLCNTFFSMNKYWNVDIEHHQLVFYYIRTAEKCLCVFVFVFVYCSFWSLYTFKPMTHEIGYILWLYAKHYTHSQSVRFVYLFLLHLIYLCTWFTCPHQIECVSTNSKAKRSEFEGQTMWENRRRKEIEWEMKEKQKRK